MAYYRHTVFHHLFIAVWAIVKGIVLFGFWLVIGSIGVSVWNQYSSPTNFILGIPLMLISLTLGLQAFFVMFMSIFSWQWGRTHCPFCKRLDKTSKLS